MHQIEVILHVAHIHYGDGLLADDTQSLSVVLDAECLPFLLDGAFSHVKYIQLSKTMQRYIMTMSSGGHGISVFTLNFE